MPTLMGCLCGGGRVVCTCSGAAAETAGSTEHSDLALTTRPNDLFDRDVLVLVGQDFAVLLYLDGVSIEHAHGDFLPSKFDCAIGR
jgi:hypothetical protein